MQLTKIAIVPCELGVTLHKANGVIKGGLYDHDHLLNFKTNTMLSLKLVLKNQID